MIVEALSSLAQELAQAAIDDDLERMRSLIASGSDVNHADEYGCRFASTRRTDVIHSTNALRPPASLRATGAQYRVR